MNKILTTFIIFFFIHIINAQQIITSFSSLQEAYNQITIDSSGNIIGDVEIVLTYDVNLTINTTENFFEWTKSGTNNHSIKIYSEDIANPANITGNSYSSYMLFFKNIQNIHFENVIFNNSSVGLRLDNVDNSSIKYCRFKSDTLFAGDDHVREGGGCGAATLWIGSSMIPEKSENNTIAYNWFDGPKIGTYIRKHLYQTIYLSERAKGNTIKGNTVDDPSGTSFALNHDYNTNNEVLNNCFNKTYRQVPEINYCLEDPYKDCKGRTHNPKTNKPYIYGPQTDTNDRDIFINSMQCIVVNTKDFPATVIGNSLINNYTFSDITNDERNSTLYKDTPDENSNIVVNVNIPENNNTFENNHFDSGYKVLDPYWKNYNANDTENRMVSGDFSNDGKIDDVVIFRETSETETTIDILLKREDNSFQKYSKVINGYRPERITGRIVSGDFDGDTYHDDVAVFYDYLNGSTKIHLFSFDGKNYTYQGAPSNSWWETSTETGGYFANQVSNRIVSGDFDSDGIHDDIAAFYDYGNPENEGFETRIHMFIGTPSTTNPTINSSFTYSKEAQGWWRAAPGAPPGAYNSNMITNRIVSGDFDNDNYHDDIAAFFDYGNSETRIHMFLGNKDNEEFDYSGSQGWWKINGYNSNKITGRLVSGNFDGDNFHDDIATVYDFGSLGSRVHLLLGDEDNTNPIKRFHYSGSTGWWSKTDYNANNIIGLVSGNFNENNKADGFVGLYSYSPNNSRTHVWSKENGTSSFDFINDDLGFPWVTKLNVNCSYPCIPNNCNISSRFSKNETINKEDINIKMYPNPIKSILMINYKFKPDEIIFTDINGRLITKMVPTDSNKNNITINVSELGLDKGIYFIQIRNKDKFTAKKVVVL